jgi:choline dehydrogenase-like flavoprotein
MSWTRLALRKARVDFSVGSNGEPLHAYSPKLTAAMWQAVDASDIWTLQRSAHTIGTCRMGNDLETAAVDETGQSFEIENLGLR